MGILGKEKQSFLFIEVDLKVKEEQAENTWERNFDALNI
jgi:hypothetical protein